MGRTLSNNVKFFTIGMLALALGVLTGCGSRPNALKPPIKHHHQRDPKRRRDNPQYRPKTYVPKPTSLLVSGTDYPKIMVMAMSSVKGLVATSAEAPTMIPWPATHSTTLYYQPSVQGLGSDIPGLIDRYQVTLSSPPNPVASFSSAVFSDPATAGANIESLLFAKRLSVPLAGSRVALSAGVDATVGAEGKMDILGWNQGGWLVVVAAPNRLPLSVANQVAVYMQTHLMPRPEPRNAGQALVLVNVRSNGPYTNVAWQEGRWVYSTSTYPTTAAPVTTALELASAMRDYFEPLK